jgi:hypothetical protein
VSERQGSTFQARVECAAADVRLDLTFVNQNHTVSRTTANPC